MCKVPDVAATVDDLAGWVPVPVQVAVELLEQRPSVAARLALNESLTGSPCGADPLLVDALLSAFPVDRFAVEVLGFAAPDPRKVLEAAPLRVAEVALGAARAGRFADSGLAESLCTAVVELHPDRSVFDTLLSFPSVPQPVAELLWPHASFAARVGRVCRGDLASAPPSASAEFVWPDQDPSPPSTVEDFVALWSAARFRPDLVDGLASRVLRCSAPSLVVAAAAAALEVWLTAPRVVDEFIGVLEALAASTSASVSGAAATMCCAQLMWVPLTDPRCAPRPVVVAADEFFAVAGSVRVTDAAAALERRLSVAARVGGDAAFPELVVPPSVVGALAHVVPPSPRAVDALRDVLGSDAVLWRLLFSFADSSLSLPECVELVAAVR